MKKLTPEDFADLPQVTQLVSAELTPDLALSLNHHFSQSLKGALSESLGK